MQHENFKLQLAGSISFCRPLGSEIERLENVLRDPEKTKTDIQITRLTLALAKRLKERDERTEDQVNQRLQREQEKKAAEEAEREKSLGRIRQIEVYRDAIEAAAHGKQVETVLRLESVRDGVEYLIDTNLVAERWNTLERAADLFLKLSDKDIKQGGKITPSVNGFFDACVGTSVIPPLTVIAHYAGDSHGGHTDMYVDVDGRKESYLSALRFETSLAALVEGLFIAFQLRKKGVFWHGLYGRDYNFLFTTNQLIEAVLQQNPTRIVGEIYKLDRPCGIRVPRVGTYSLLAVWPPTHMEASLI